MYLLTLSHSCSPIVLELWNNVNEVIGYHDISSVQRTITDVVSRGVPNFTCSESSLPFASSPSCQLVDQLSSSGLPAHRDWWGENMKLEGKCAKCSMFSPWLSSLPQSCSVEDLPLVRLSCTRILTSSKSRLFCLLAFRNSLAGPGTQVQLRSSKGALELSPLPQSWCSPS